MGHPLNGYSRQACWPRGSLFGRHWDPELHTIIWVCTGRREPAAKLQIVPKQWPGRPVKYKAHATHRAFDPYLDETLKVRSAIKVENAGKRFCSRNRPCAKVFKPEQEWEFPQRRFAIELA